MKPEPLKLIRLDNIYFHLHKSERVALEENIKSAVDWLIVELKNLDCWCIDCINKKITKAFQDVIK